LDSGLSFCDWSGSEPLLELWGVTVPVTAMQRGDGGEGPLAIRVGLTAEVPCVGVRVLYLAGNVLLVKGAAECILERCDRVMLPDGKVVQLTAAARGAILDCVDGMAANALRILALARK
jgi:hypothetical protein